MIQKSKFLKDIWFVEAPLEANDHNKIIKKELISPINAPKSLFLTKLATEEDWKKLDLMYLNYIGFINYTKFKGDKEHFIDPTWGLNTATESGLSLLKAENLDNNKNWLIIREEI